jgi:hypothetical protein
MAPGRKVIPSGVHSYRGNNVEPDASGYTVVPPEQAGFLYLLDIEFPLSVHSLPFSILKTSYIHVVVVFSNVELHLRVL